MPSNPRVLLVEHLDATGAAASDARLHAAALRAAGWDVEGLVLEDSHGADLLFPSRTHRHVSGFDVHGHDGLHALAARVRASAAACVLWASATPGGGEAARVLPDDVLAYWWPTGHAPATLRPGPLHPLDTRLAPVGGSAIADDHAHRRWLSLWDGPFALVPTLPSARTAERLLDAFANEAEGAEGVDLVVLDHPDEGFERLARAAGVAQRVHFVGPAPREAEHAWLGTATVALLAGDAPISGGLVLRALAAGCPLLAVGTGAEPIAAWLERAQLTWVPAVATLGETLSLALRRAPEVAAVRERGRQAAAAHGANALGKRLADALRSHTSQRRAA